MGTSHYICIETRKKSVSNKEQETHILWHGTVYKMAQLARLAGKIKEFVLSHKTAASFDIKTDYNGFGYGTVKNFYVLGAKDFATAYEMETGKKVAAKKATVDPVQKWAKRLASLTGITVEEATEVANEKLAYKQQQLDKMNDREAECASRERTKLIRKMERENPLRPIRDAEHAYAILAASRRHNSTDYEKRLDEARELAATGDIEREEVKDYARTHYKY